MEYTNCHVHSEHSLLDGAAKIEDLAKSAKELGHRYLSLTDHGSLSGALQHKKACEKNGVLPIYGSELYMIEDLEKSKAGEYQANLHLTVLAKNQRGFEKLIKGLNYANINGVTKKGRFKRAFLPIRYPLENDWAGDIVILSGCSSSVFYNLEKTDGIDLMRQYADTFKSDFYGEMMPLDDWEAQKTLNEIVQDVSTEMNFKNVITNDIHYCKAEDHEMHELVICLGQYGVKWSDEKRWKFSTHKNYFRKGEEMLEAMAKMGTVDPAWLKNTMEVAEKCHFKLQKYPLDLPNPYPGQDEEQIFNIKCEHGISAKYAEIGAEIRSRLEYEKKVLKDKGFIRYMLLVEDMVNWAKRNGIVIGPGRGSAAGSIVAYALGITDINPLKYDLSFDRFIAPDKVELPDIDIDTGGAERELIERYLKEKYGSNSVAHVITYGKALGRGALRDVSRVFEVPLMEADAASKEIIKQVEGHPRFTNTIEDSLEQSEILQQFKEKYPKVVTLAKNIEGLVRSTGTHAGGFVISNSHLSDSGRAYMIDGDKGHSLNWDKSDLEFFGFVKVDLLGLSTHSVISECLRLLQSRKKKIDLSSIPLNDKEVLNTIGRGDTATMFQLSAPGTAAFCRDLKPDTFEDIAAILALWRPGPIIAGMAKEYVEVKFGRKTPVYLCKEHEEIASKTRGQLIYQEQLSSLLMNMAGFTYVEADKVRKIVAKKLGAVEWQQMGDKFVKGCLSKGTVKEDVAKRLWRQLEGWASYSFNASHAFAYALVAYWTAYLKVHFPAEWICAYLNYGSVDRETKDGDLNLDICLQDGAKLGLKILPPDINQSREEWTVESDLALRAGLKELVGVGETTRLEIARARQASKGFPSFELLMKTVNRRIVNKKVIRSMVYAGALDNLKDQKWEAWRGNFEEMFETYGTKKFEEAEKKGLETPAKFSLSEYLNYDTAKIDRASTIGETIVEILGKGYRLDSGFIIQESDGKRWSVTDAARGNLQGIKSTVLRQSQVGIKHLQKEAKECEACDLRKGCKRPVPVENGFLNAMVVAEAPGAKEDIKGLPLVGDSGQLLFNALDEMDLDRTLFYIGNAISCRPTNNELSAPEKAQKYVDNCPHLKKAIQAVSPRVILALGNKALYFFKRQSTGIMRFNGTTEWHPEYKCWVTYCIHPSAVLHGEKEDLYEKFKKGLEEWKRIVVLLLEG